MLLIICVAMFCHVFFPVKVLLGCFFWVTGKDENHFKLSKSPSGIKKRRLPRIVNIDLHI